MAGGCVCENLLNKAACRPSRRSHQPAQSVIGVIHRCRHHAVPVLVDPVGRPVRLHRRARCLGCHHHRLTLDHRVRVRPAHQHRCYHRLVRVPGVVPVFVRPNRRHLPPFDNARRRHQPPQGVIGEIHYGRHHAVAVLVHPVRRPVRLHRRARRHGQLHHRLPVNHHIGVRALHLHRCHHPFPFLVVRDFGCRVRPNGRHLPAFHGPRRPHQPAQGVICVIHRCCHYAVPVLVHPVRRSDRLHRPGRRYRLLHHRLPLDHDVPVRPLHLHRRHHPFPFLVVRDLGCRVRPNGRHLPPLHAAFHAHQPPQIVIGVVHNRRHHAVTVFVIPVRRSVRLHRRARRHGLRHHRLPVDHRVGVRPAHQHRRHHPFSNGIGRVFRRRVRPHRRHLPAAQRSDGARQKAARVIPVFHLRRHKAIPVLVDPVGRPVRLHRRAGRRRPGHHRLALDDSIPVLGLKSCGLVGHFRGVQYPVLIFVVPNHTAGGARSPADRPHQDAARVVLIPHPTVHQVFRRPRRRFRVGEGFIHHGLTVNNPVGVGG